MKILLSYLSCHLQRPSISYLQYKYLQLLRYLQLMGFATIKPLNIKSLVRKRTRIKHHNKINILQKYQSQDKMKYSRRNVST